MLAKSFPAVEEPFPVTYYSTGSLLSLYAYIYSFLQKTAIMHEHATIYALLFVY